ncbi:MAG: hypothetical protein US71_C0002G0043 [Parcubacteria group bacterium GW2011_GWD2_38_12]|nr:MAG: hypothetical protein US06_C0003G0015 [Parcubacteria group bacterium GW2011_GWC2_36_17]KKQ52646.1 MAG: hypothetical protein US71_C0002G0043 [Parcubacteria group bacterium GW2011_GWD2_38_12]KKQ59599.1 MAG: hypothetical protein US78_C0002G0062 [Parcubacteria group bacterium GW2011_GWD1_38_16]
MRNINTSVMDIITIVFCLVAVGAIIYSDGYLLLVTTAVILLIFFLYAAVEFFSGR